MLRPVTSLLRRTTRIAPGARHLSSPASEIPVTQVASVLKLNVGDEAKALLMDCKMKEMLEMMRAHEGFEGATRYVCKTVRGNVRGLYRTPRAVVLCLRDPYDRPSLTHPTLPLSSTVYTT